MKHYLHSDETLFRNRDVFEIDHVPEEFDYRESQMKELAFAVKPGLDGGRPLNMILRGTPGTGKTTSVKQIFSEIEEASTEIYPVYINCQVEKSVYSVLSKIYAAILGHMPSQRGVAIPFVLHAIGDRLSEKRKVLIVCLDDANYLIPGNCLNTLLFLLLRLHDEHPSARAGVLLPISDLDVDLKNRLDRAVLSVLRPTEIYFPPYTLDEIRGILKQRIKVGLYPNVLSNEVFEVLVDHTMESGDTRVGLDLIKRGVMSAERAGRGYITEADITSSFDEANLVHMYLAIHALSPDERKLLGYIAGLSAREIDVPLTTGQVFEASHEYCPISYTGLYSKLKKFNDMRLIDMSHRPGGGRTREIVLRYNASKMREGCEG